jgi:hypothetical protein
MLLAGSAALALVACGTPHASGARASDVGTESADRFGEFSSSDSDDERDDNGDGRSYEVVLTAGGRPPPRPPPPPPRPTGRPNPRDREREPARPGHVPGRRLAGPPDAPYWQPVFEIPWRGPVLQGPKPTPPERAPVQVAEPTPRASSRAPQQPGQPPSARGAQQAPSIVKGLGDITHAGPLKPDVALKAAQRWLGAGYKEIAPGVYRSADGLRQFRMTTSDLVGAQGKLGSHVHFEALNARGVVVENLHVPLLP